MSSAIDCQLTHGVHYTDKPEPQHDDVHSRNTLITTYESLTVSLSPSLSLNIYKYINIFPLFVSLPSLCEDTALNLVVSLKEVPQKRQTHH